MRSSCIFAGLLSLALFGCGGGGATDSASRAGYYRGDLTFNGLGPMPPGAAPMMADMLPTGEFEAYARSDSFAAGVVNGSSQDLMDVNGQIVVGDVVHTVAGDDVSFAFRVGGNVVATGTLRRSPLPQLGSIVGIPPRGDYRGELVVVSNGRGRAFGRVSATVDANADFVAHASGGRGWVDGALFSGQFQRDGTLANALISVGGRLIPQRLTPYSFDGRTLIVRFDQLALEPASCWLILQPL